MHRESSGETAIPNQSRRNTDSSTAPLNIDLERVADAVTQRMRPEMQNQIAQAIGTAQRSPSVSVTPSTDQQPNSSGINAITSLNLAQNCDTANISPITSFNDDLGIHVSQQTRDKIINGEFIELESLLDITHDDHTKNIVVDNHGNLSLKQKTGKKILDINTWIDAFLTYTSIYTAAHPNSTQGLLKYIFNIKLGASRCSGQGWLSYDRQFRLKRSRNTSMNWGVVDMELWLLYISQGQTQPKESQISWGKCYTYNNRGRCGRQSCPYRHRCLKCSGPHAAIYCTLSKSDSNLKPEAGPPRTENLNASDFNGKSAFQNKGFRFRQSRSFPVNKAANTGDRKNTSQSQY